jgi:hypothetical protein
MRSKEEFRQSMFSKISEWQSSGLNQKTFCEQQNLKYFVFHYWYKRYRDEQQQATAVPKGFIELKPSALSSDMFAELIVPNGMRIILHQPVSSDYLHALLQ